MELYEARGQEPLGSGVVSAYQIESRQSIYPRICVGPKFLAYLGLSDSDEKLNQMGCPKEAILPTKKRSRSFEICLS